MRDDDEPIEVETDTRKWWQDRYITLAPGWQTIVISSGILALIAALRNLH